MIDLEYTVLDGHLDRLAVDRVHLNARARFVVTDDVDPSCDESNLERAHLVHVDDSRAVYKPLLPGHGFSCQIKLYRVHCHSRYIASSNLARVSC